MKKNSGGLVDAWRTQPPDLIGFWWLGWFTTKGQWCTAHIHVNAGQLEHYTWPVGYYAPSDAIETTPPAMPENDGGQP